MFPPEIRESCPASSRLPHEQTLALIARARVMMAPSLSDGIPNSMMEAMALGAVPLVSPIETIIPVVRAEENVVFARNLYPQEIADALVRLMSDDPLVDRIAARNTVRVYDLADRTRFRGRVLEYYEQVAGGRGFLPNAPAEGLS
jgi:glycosyltransferase involved in cell wall biosynthesis